MDMRTHFFHHSRSVHLFNVHMYLLGPLLQRGIRNMAAFSALVPSSLFKYMSLIYEPSLGPQTTLFMLEQPFFSP
jgi:hypothetical protein